jgi:hypothetical protein
MNNNPQTKQIPVDLKNSIQKLCPCGGRYFQPVIEVFTVSALVSPIGQELVVQKPGLMCLECKVVLEK